MRVLAGSCTQNSTPFHIFSFFMKTHSQPYEILQEVMGDVDFPVLAEFDCCHTHPMLTVPIGAKVRLDADAQTVTLLEE